MSLGKMKGSLGRINGTDQKDEEILELSYEDTRRPEVQILTTPPKILNVLLKMETNAKGRITVYNTEKRLRFLYRNADLDNPEQVKQFIAKRKCGDGNKKLLAIAYNKYVKYHGLTWEMPLYKQKSKAIQIPTTQKVQMLIANTKNPLSMKLRISGETGIRPVEMYDLKAKDINTETRKIYPTTHKDGAS